jgi:hypothetical protein
MTIKVHEEDEYMELIDEIASDMDALEAALPT